MLDFKELSQSGKEFELLIRELLFNKNYQVYWSGVGPDGGRDLICIEEKESFFAPEKKKWLIQCKHNAHSHKSVGVSDLDEIVDSCEQHEATGFILACSTQPSSGVVSRLESITNNSRNNITAIYWDYVSIERFLNTPQLWRIAQKFFPISSESKTWRVFATEKPNHWVVNYKGYYFNLANRIGSSHEYYFESIEARIADIEDIDLPEGHFIRPRAVYYNDKSGCYTWYIDYMYPNGGDPELTTAELKHILGDGYALEDGQIYTFDVKRRAYLSHSDHYDPDHYDYYNNHMYQYLHGFERESGWEDYHEASSSKDALDEFFLVKRVEAFDELSDKISNIEFIRLVRKENASMEYLDKFHMQRNWSELIESSEIDSDRFFSVWFLLRVSNEAEFHKLVTYFPQEFNCHFRITKPFIYIPTESGERSMLSRDQTVLYEITISLNPMIISNKFIARAALNRYLNKLSKSIDSYISQSSIQTV
ncbi:restriction endonuclease [Photobacterium damselae]|uniref:restriction endonuclease n=1 Tax=Photobacterium damselae TaxID=38293 RepID=UPI0040692156